MNTWIKNRKNIFSCAGLVLACICLIGLNSILSHETNTADAQTVAGWNTRAYRQVPADGLTAISGGEAVGYQFGFNGATWDRSRVPNVTKSVALGSGTTETTIWTPASGKKFRIMGMILTASAATTLTFKDNTSGTTIFTLRLGTDAPVVIPPSVFGNGILSGAADRVLTVTRGTAATLDGVIVGQEN